ncbi:MAG: S41 family peptidase [Cyanobacteriota bacterium]|nr:S41 family peptidase [Cyanobacteriota bacterium]
MPKRRELRRHAALACVLGLWLLLAAPALALSDAQQLVVEAWRLVNQSYVDPSRFEAVHWKRLRQKTLEQPIETSTDAYAAIGAMLAPLGDPYTRLLLPEEYSSLKANTQGSVSGVGLQLALRSIDDQIVVIAPLDGSPAADAGIASGTAVLAVNGSSTRQLGLEGTANLLRGTAGSRVLLLLETPGGQRRELELQRRTVDLRPVRHRLIQQGSRRLGYLRITQFAEPVPAQVQEALTSEAFAAIDGLILDLRNNSGGLVSAGLAVANQLLDNEPIVTTQDRDGLSSPAQAGPGLLYGGPLLTLVNGGTASASEILAGALQDDGRSPLLGSRTFGKGLIQTLIPLGDGSGLAVTVARYLTPSGRDIQHQGIEPDLNLQGPEPLNPGGEDDRWLEQAAALLLERLA